MLKKLQAKRATLLREAAAFTRADGTFEDDAARTSFDAKMTEIEALDEQIRELTPADPAQPPAPVDAAAREAAVVEERQRAETIRTAVRLANLEGTVADDLVARGVSVEVARSTIFARLAELDAARPTNHRIGLGEDARDKWMRGATAWLLQRAGLAAMVATHEGAAAAAEPGEFRGLSLLDLAREALERHGVKTRGMDKMTLAGQAMAFRANYQTASDFAVLLESTLNKVLQAAYAMTPDTWSKWCGTASATDFRSHNWYRMGALSALDDLTEQGEFKNKAIPDTEKGTFSASTKGNIIAITRQVIVNDDIGATTRLMTMLGRAGKLTIEKGAYALLLQNSGLGPTQSDAQPLFHANRANVSTGAALAAAAIDADRVVMASQLEPGGQEYTDLRPAVLLVPVGLGGVARVINQSQYDPDTVANKAQTKPNVVAGLFRDVVDTPRITGTRRYLFADPGIAPVFVVSFLEGQQEPVLETMEGWRTDGVEMRARLDVGVNAVDWRGTVTNAGA